MKKKGASHVDWVISFAIFFIYLVLLFVFIKPTYRPMYSGDALLNIVRTNFENDTDFLITKTPLFIDCDDCVGPNEEVIVEWPFTFNDFCLIREDPIESVDYSVVGDELKMRTEFDQPRNTLYIIYSDEIDVSCEAGVANCGGPGDPEGECVPTTLDEIDGSNYEYGLSEYIRGISDTKISGLPNYDLLKELWHFPDKKEFAIYVYDITQEDIIESVNKEGYDKLFVSDEDVEVFVDQWVDQILDEDTTKETVIINIRVW